MARARLLTVHAELIGQRVTTSLAAGVTHIDGAVVGGGRHDDESLSALVGVEVLLLGEVDATAVLVPDDVGRRQTEDGTGERHRRVDDDGRRQHQVGAVDVWWN